MNAMKKRRREESWECSYCGDDGCGGRGSGKRESMIYYDYENENESSGGGGGGVVFLHNVEHKGMFRLLCTNCVLITHPDLFCSICLQPFQPQLLPLAQQRLICLKCPSIAHLSCSSSSSSSSSSSFLCPPCTSSTSSTSTSTSTSPFRWFFSNNNSSSKQEANANANGVLFDRDRNRDRDRDNAKALLAAATIAAFSMNKAAVSARAHAERLVKDALSAKNRAIQALDFLAHLLAIDDLTNQPTTT